MRFIRGCSIVKRKLRFYFFPALIALAVVALLACEKKTETDLLQSESLKIDSVLLSNFALLDSVASNLFAGIGMNYPMVPMQESAMTMYEITGISAGNGGSDIGLLFVDSIEVMMWRDWIKENRNRLKWDSTSQSITVEELPQDST